MTRAEIQAFLAVVEYGSISRAANELFLRQSTLSGRIQALEAELDTTLFKRGKGIRSTELTAQGIDFIPIAQKWEQLWQQTLTAANKQHSTVLCVSAILSVNTYIMAQAYSMFAAAYPAVQLRLLIRHSDDAYHFIENGGAQAAFVTKVQFSKRVEDLRLFREKMLLVCNENYPVDNDVHPSELDVSREILLDWHREFGQWHDYWFGENSVPRVYTDDMIMMEKFLRTESCWAVVPESVARALQTNSHIRIKSLQAAPSERTVYMIMRRSAMIQQEVRLLLSCMRKVIELQGGEWVYGEIPRTP